LRISQPDWQNYQMFNRYAEGKYKARCYPAEVNDESSVTIERQNHKFFDEMHRTFFESQTIIP